MFSTLVVTGEKNPHTAMSKTVGLPIAIAVKLILQGKISLRGVKIPVDRQIYEPVMKELKEYGIEFTERDILIS
jgi:saccharopine dehydrogenase (NAD+, L-glutamate forming)